MSLNILIADDIQNRSDSKKYKRSVLIRNTAAQFAEKLNDNVDFIFVEDYKKIRSKEEMARMEKEHDINLTLMNDLKDFFPRPFNPHLRAGSPAEEIIKFIKKRALKIEMVIMGTEGKTGLKNLFLGSVAEEVIRNSKTPIMVLGPKVQAADYKLSDDIKILLLSDLEETSMPAEKFAAKLAKKLNASVTISYSLWEQVKLSQEAALVSGVPFFLNDNYDQMKNDMESLLKKKAKAFLKRKISARHKLFEEPLFLADLATKEAAQGYSIIIMGTRHRNKIMKAFLGSNARQTVHESPVPVIIVPS